jgi:UDP-N-acetylmuramoyl-tripeptide--D-alanyl-D-alanine ligase
MKLRAAEVAEVVGGELTGPDVEIEGADIDSRELRAGQLFVPVVAERDGHDFIDAAVMAGAPAYLTSRPPAAGATTAIMVADTSAALTQLGRAARDRLGPHVVGITGSVGKTTTKDLAAAASRRTHATHASVRSFNNELGVPLTLVNAPDDTYMTVVEMGARGIGHIAALCEVARPTIGVVTAVELVHAELMGGLDSIAKAKGELVEALPASGTAVLNADNERVAAMASRTSADVLRYGLGEADVRADRIDVGPDLRPTFRLSSPWGDAEVNLAVRGVHNVSNALAAASIALVTGVDLGAVAVGLGEAVPSPWRMELHETASGAVVVNDAYNAGPASMEAALRALAHLDATRSVAVLGPMAELGDHSIDEHRRIGELANDLGIEVVAVGAPDYGAAVVADIDAAFDAVGVVGAGDAVLVKGSRVAGLETLAQRLLAAHA